MENRSAATSIWGGCFFQTMSEKVRYKAVREIFNPSRFHY